MPRLSRLRRAFLLLLPLFWPAPSVVALEAGPVASVVETVDGDTVRLEDGSEVRLVGLQAPKLPLGRPNFPTWPLAEEARAALAELVEGKRVRLWFGGARRDRHGRHLAHLRLGETAEGTWVQGEMLRRGMARVYTFVDNRAEVPTMLALEREARAARRGIWALDFYAVRQHDALDRHIGTFQLVEGEVTGAAVVRGRGYLNFGPDRMTDFTAMIPPDAVRLFRKEGVDPTSFAGRPVRIRGWLRWYDGPQIEVTHPEQIEALER